MKTHTSWWLMGLAAALLAWPTTASARDKDEVLNAIKARYPALLKLLADHKAGETAAGLIDAAKSDAANDKIEVQGKAMTVAEFIQAENADRSEYFQIAAKSNNTSPTVVAKNYARYRYGLLKSGEYWKPEGGEWTQKK